MHSAIINYFRDQMRYLEQQNLQQNSQLEPEELKKLEARLQLIDTTLLKCYIKVVADFSNSSNF